jgi:hypothetical protein
MDSIMFRLGGLSSSDFREKSEGVKNERGPFQQMIIDIEPIQVKAKSKEERIFEL